METKVIRNQVPTLEDIYQDNQELAFQNERLNLLLNQEPKKEWVTEHPTIKGHRYIPIDKVEFMLKKIFGKYKIEILREGSSFNGVYVVVRVWYQHPLTGEMEFHDGIGAWQLQTKKGTSPADLANINNGALSMAYPIAKTIAIKDACDHFGKLFGADLNRRDTIAFLPTFTENTTMYEDLAELYEAKKGVLSADENAHAMRILSRKEVTSYNKLFNILKSL